MKFKVGDRARLVYTRNNTTNNPNWRKGIIVNIVDIEDGISNLGSKYNYIVDTNKLIVYGYVLEDQLEPIVKEKSSWKIIERITNWNPNNELVV